MLRALLIDDEPLASQVVQEFLLHYPQVEVVGVCHNGFEGLKAIQQLKPDLLFLDIQMPKINGFEMLELIDTPPPVIFTTAFDEYAIRAFEQNAVDYLLKPFTQERFNKAMDKFLNNYRANTTEGDSGAGVGAGVAGAGGGAMAGPSVEERTRELLETAARSPRQADRIVIRDNSNIRIIPVEEIQFLEAADDYVRIVTAAGAWLKNRTMAAMEKQLPPEHFVRIHRSYIVNVKEITRLHPHEKESWLAVLRNGRQLPVSKSGYPRLKSILGV